MTDWEKIYNDMYSKGEGPFYTEFLYKILQDSPTAGIASCDWEDAASYPYLFPHKTQIVEHFNLRFKFREIGGETQERWQYLVDRVFDNVKRKYDYMFGLYANNEVDKLGRILSETYNLVRDSSSSGTSHSANSGTDNTTSESKFQDMPVQQFIESGNYATNITNGTNNNTTSGTNDGTSSGTVHTTDDLTRAKTENDNTILEQVNSNADMWRDLVDSFVDEFKVCFINEIGKV